MNRLFSKSFSNGTFEVYDDKPEFDLIEVHQVHSNRNLSSQGENLITNEADGIVISFENLQQKALAIKTADCLPVLFLGKESLALVHAGWKGIQTGILTQPEILGINPLEIFIGPSIYKYEVQKEFKGNFPNSPHFEQLEDKLYFHLQEEASDQLKTYFPNARINESLICTLENYQYNSYRRNKTNKRNWNIFRI